jgi:hypothetical protein
MTANAPEELRKAIRARLIADADVAALVGERIYSQTAPEGAAFPYLTISSESVPFDTHTERGSDHKLTIHYHGQCEGQAEGDRVYGATKLALRGWITSATPAALSGHKLSLLEWQLESVFAGEAGGRYEGGQRWRALTEES